MKTLILLAVAVLVATAGCSNDDSTPASEPIVVEMYVGETHTVSLESNPTTGHSWQVGYTDEIVELVELTYRSDSELVGAGGYEDFVFKALSVGDTEIELLYKRPWEDDVIERQPIVFHVLSDPS